MSDNPNKGQNELAATLMANEQQTDLRQRAGKIADLLKFLTEEDRKRVLDMAMNELSSRLGITDPAP